MILNMSVMVFAAEMQGEKDEPTLADNKIGGTKETDYTLYMANGESFVNVGDESVKTFLTIDKRFFDVEDITMTLEIRQYNDSGYTVVGTAEYNYEALQQLAKLADSENESTYTFREIEIHVADGKSFNEGWMQYCVVKFNRPSWVDSEGEPAYRWTYTGDAAVLGENVNTPAPIVWLYNLDENSHRGALIRSILTDLNIAAGTVNNENLNQNIGYLVGWEGYEPVSDPYSSESYDVEYILMGNLTEVQLDEFIEGMQENNIRVNLKSVPTAWTAGKTFAELFDIMAEEDEVMKAAVALDEMIYEAESLDEEVYGNNPYWNEFKATLADAIVALSTDAEESGEGAALYLNARDALLNMYLKVSGKNVLIGDLELILEKQDDGTYRVSAKLNGEHENAEFDYSWKPTGSTETHIILPADQLYKVNLEIKGTGKYYGELTAKLNVPEIPSFTTDATDKTITVKINENEGKLNTPATKGFVAQLYFGGELIESQEIEEIDSITFDDLIEKTEYVVKVYSYNVIGRSDIIESSVVTAEAELETGPNQEETPEQEETLEKEENPKKEENLDQEKEPELEDDVPEDEELENEDNVEQEEENKYPEDGENTEIEDEVDEVAKTGDSSNLLLWVTIMVITAAGSFASKKKKVNS